MAIGQLRSARATCSLPILALLDVDVDGAVAVESGLEGTLAVELGSVALRLVRAVSLGILVFESLLVVESVLGVFVVP